MSLSAQIQPLGVLLDAFQRQSGIRLVYANTLVDSIHISVRISDLPFEALKKLLKSTPFDFIQQHADLWIIVPRSETRHLPGAIVGKIIDTKNNHHLDGVSVFLHDTNLGATTDSAGSFALYGIPSGRYSVGVRRIGYAKHDFILTVPGNSRRRIIVRLQAKPIFTKEITVEDERIAENATPSLAVQTLSRDDLALSPQSGGQSGDIFELLHRLPGVSRRDPDDVFPHIEGGSADELLVELDGMPINVPTFGRNARSIFTIDAIELVSIYRSGYAANFGGALSGVVSMHSRDLNELNSQVEIGLGARGASLSLAKNFGRFGWMSTWQGNPHAREFILSGLQSQAVLNKAAYRLSQNKKLTLLALFGRDTFTQTNSLEMPRQTSHHVGLRYDWQGQEQENFSLLFYRSGLPAYLHETGVKLDAQKRLSTNSLLGYGLHAFHLRSRGTVLPDSLQLYKNTRFSFLDYETLPYDIFDQNVSLVSPYFNYAHKTKSLLIHLGLRAPVDIRHLKIKLSPRAMLRFSPAENVHISFATGRYFQFVDRNYASEAKSGDAFDRGEYVVTSDASGQSYAGHFRGEITHRTQSGLTLTAALFLKKYAFHNRAYLARINTQFWLLPVAKGRSDGVEFTVGKTYGRHRGWLSYTLNRLSYTSEQGASFRPYFNRRKVLSATFLHELSPFLHFKWYYAVLSGFPARKWQFELPALDPELPAEEFAREHFIDASEEGARTDLGLGLSWFFAGPKKSHTLDLFVQKNFNTDLLPDPGEWRFGVWLNLAY